MDGSTIRPLSSTMEEITEPQPTTHAADLAPDITSFNSVDRRSTWSLVNAIINGTTSQPAGSANHGRSSSSTSSHSFSSSASRSGSSGTGRFLDLRNRRFPPVPPSANIPRAPPSSWILQSQLAKLASLSLDAGSSGSPISWATSPSNADLAAQGNNHGRVNRNGADKDAEEGHTDLDAEYDQRVQDAWARLQVQRAAVRRLRLQVHRRKRRLRRPRTIMDDADNAFISLIRDDIATPRSIPYTTKVFVHHFEILQKSRNEYLSQAVEVDQLEDQLAEAELDLEVRETDFFGILFGYAHTKEPQETLPPSVSDLHIHGPPSRASLLGISADRPVDVHPLYEQLMDAVGDRENAKEHYTELMMHHGSILFDLELAIKRERLRDAEGRPDKLSAVVDKADIDSLASVTANPGKMDEELDRYKTQIGSDNWNFLLEFPKQETLAIERMAAARAQVDRLRQLCIDKGLMPKHLPYYEEYIIFADTGKALHDGTMSISQEQSPRHQELLARSRFSILLSNPRHVLQLDTPFTALKKSIELPKDDPTRPQQVAEAIKEHNISTLLVETQAEDKSEFVNRWLLQRLRTSSLEIEMLYTVFVFETRLKVQNDRRWQEDVLFFWSRDACNYPKEHFRGPVTAWSSSPSVIDDAVGTGKSDPWSGTSRRLGSSDSASDPPSSTKESFEPSDIDLHELIPALDSPLRSGTDLPVTPEQADGHQSPPVAWADPQKALSS